jgi:hypothetical protein
VRIPEKLGGPRRLIGASTSFTGRTDYVPRPAVAVQTAMRLVMVIVTHDT